MCEMNNPVRRYNTSTGSRDCVCERMRRDPHYITSLQKSHRLPPGYIPTSCELSAIIARWKVEDWGSVNALDYVQSHFMSMHRGAR